METNLARLADSALERLGDHPSLFFEGAWHSSGVLHERSTRLASGLRTLGLRPGDRVVVIMANCPEVSVLYHAVWRAGAVVTPVVFLLTAIELRHILVDSSAVAVFTTPELLPKVTEAVENRPITVVVLGGGAAGSWPASATIDFADLEAGQDPLPIVDRAPDDLAALMYTGGTTGRSKGVALSHANLSNAGASSRARSHVPGVNRGQISLPLSHAFGLLVTVGAMHVPEPGSSVLQRWFEPESFLRLAVEHRSQSFAVVPSMLAMMLAYPLETMDLSELRFVFSGAAPLSPAVRDEFQRRVPSCTVVEGYGCTETGGIISGMPPLQPRPGTVGKAVDNVELRIVGIDGSDQPVGEDGEIVVRGPNVMAGYWGGEALTGGWFHTGDIGRLDADGYLTIVDRMKDLIIRGGYNVYPRDVEDALLDHPEVTMAAVVGRPDPRLGEEVAAFVSLAADAAATEADLIEFAKGRLAANKYPRSITILPAIPLTSVGKLDRKRLRAEITAAAAPAAVPPPGALPPPGAVPPPGASPSAENIQVDV
jgi:long-chain acyl-CoA synthetase